MNVCSIVVVPLRLQHSERRWLWTMSSGEQRRSSGTIPELTQPGDEGVCVDGSYVA